MWYKTAKYGTLWDRLGPESEQEIDRILDESTYRTKIIEDGKIDSKDVPELINLINLIHKTINKNKTIPTSMDKKEFIKKFVHILLILFITPFNISNADYL